MVCPAGAFSNASQHGSTAVARTGHSVIYRALSAAFRYSCKLGPKPASSCLLIAHAGGVQLPLV